MEDIDGVGLVKTLLWYDFGDSSILLPLLEMVVEHIRSNTYISGYSIIPFEDNPIEMRTFFGDQLFGALVLVYGDYGMSPRLGWISDLQNFKKLVQDLIKDEISVN